jgi:hypothetical protein
VDDSFHCPTCGAPLRIRNRFVKAVTCEFCQNVALYDGVRLDPTGRTASDATIPSPLYLDATGTLGKRAFRVIGRLVYEYDGGVWQEWFLELGDGARAWLEEDEGQFTLLEKQPLAEAPPFESVRVGDRLTLAGREVTVNEVDEATIVSAEGQFGTLILPGEAIQYVDAASGEEEVGLEYGEREVEMFLGRPVPRGAVVIDPDPFS